MREKGLTEKEVFRLLLSHKEKDELYEDGRILNSMSTLPLEIARKAHMMFFETNLGNPDLFPGTVEMERDVIRILSSLMHLSPPNGAFLSGGTEANFTAAWYARETRGRGRMLVPQGAHFSLRKAASILGLEFQEIPLAEGYVMDVGALERAMGDDVSIVVAMAGSTIFGTVDPVGEIGKVLEGYDAHFHVDAAFGGFVLPFLEDLGLFRGAYDFRVKRVDSLCLDPHKMGMATIPAGVLLFRRDMMAPLSFPSPYLTREATPGFLGTRASGAVAATYAALLHLGREGYREIVRRCMENTLFLKSLLEDEFEIPVDPVTNVLNVRVSKPVEYRDYLREQEWYVSAIREYGTLRMVIMPHLSEDVLVEFSEELIHAKRVIG